MISETPPQTLGDEHPAFALTAALFRCRELGAALARYASAGTLATVRRSLAEGARGQKKTWVNIMSLGGACPGARAAPRQSEPV